MGTAGSPSAAVEQPQPVTVAESNGGEMPVPVNIAPQAVFGPSAVSVPAGSGDVALSIIGILLLIAGVGGLAASAVWMIARRRPIL